MGDRIKYWPGNALTDDFGENRYDLILISNLMHHFSAEQNSIVCQKATKALKPGGYFVVQEYLKPKFSDNMKSMATVTVVFSDIIFNITSASKTLSLDDIKELQKKAGLKHHQVNNFRMMPSFVQVCAKK